MKIGFIGLGKLGLPVAVAIAERGYDVYGFDINSKMINSYKKGVSSLYEPDMDARLKKVLKFKKMNFVKSIADVVKTSEIIFVPVQTPHPPELDGSIRHNHVKKDFDYTFLIDACKDVARTLKDCKDFKVISIISTVLPTTTKDVVLPELKKIYPDIAKHICYNPSFIAMGRTIQDFVNPEFTLIGEPSRNSQAGYILENFYKTIHNSPILRMSWTEAEATKMCYNTFIGFKIIFANTLMEMCHKVGANCDVVSEALIKAYDRLISSNYLKGGMGDGGGCHPRDNLALSSLSSRLDLDYNIFDFVMTVREKQTEWLADLIADYMTDKRKQVVILGKTYKPNTNLTYGSPSLLLYNILLERDIKAHFYDPETDPKFPPSVPSVYLIGTMWPQFKAFKFAKGSVVIDPWGWIKEVPEGVELISVGRMTNE